MKISRLVATLLALIALSCAALAKDAPPKPWEGVWRGTLGAYPVVACLQENGLGMRQGAYYYLSKKVPIPLSFDKTAGVWQEGAGQPKGAGPLWSLSPSAGDHLNGNGESTDQTC